MPLEFHDVPVRRWRRQRGLDLGELVYTRQYERVMSLIGRAIAAGGAVDVDVRIVERTEKDRPLRNGAAYDVMTARIEMPPGVALPTAYAKKNGKRINQ